MLGKFLDSLQRGYLGVTGEVGNGNYIGTKLD